MRNTLIVITILSIFIIIFISYFLINRVSLGKVDNVEVIIGDSDKFSENEIVEAMEAVKVKFKDLKGCELKKYGMMKKNLTSN